MRKTTKRILVSLLCLALSLNLLSTDVLADGINPDDGYSCDFSEGNSDIDGVIDESIVDELNEAENEESDEDNIEAEDDCGDNELSDETGGDTNTAEEETNDEYIASSNIEDSETEDTGSEAFYRELTADEIKDKEMLADDYAYITDSDSSRYYVSNQMFRIVETREEAISIAEAYTQFTGYKVELLSYQYKVAIYGISGDTKLRGMDSLDRVQSLTKVASDVDNNLPAISPDYIRTIDSVGDSIFTAQEHFSDPFLNWENDPEGYKQYNPYYQWYHDKINDKYVWRLMDLGVAAYTRSKLESVTVAVIDSGIDWTHEDFSGIIIDKTSFVPEGPDIKKGQEPNQGADERAGMDFIGHGTNVAGIIGSIAANAIGGRGVAAGVKLASIRVINKYGYGSSSAIAKGLEWCVEKQAEHNIKVINLSLGGPLCTSSEERAVQDAFNAGILVVAAAGNENCDGNHYPACYNNVVSVAALNSDMKRAAFSNYGNTVDLAAPGGEFRNDAQSNGFVVQEELYEAGSTKGESFVINGHAYSGMQGTSQAAPIVSAAAALVFAYYEDPYGLTVTPTYVEQRLKETATKISTDKPCGAGCINVAAALDITKSALVDMPTANYPSGALIPLDGTVTLDFGVASEYNSDALIFYTLDGKNPDLANYGKYGNNTRIYTGPILVSGTGRKTLKAITYIYGKVSPVATFNYTIDDKLVSSISVVSSTGQYSLGVGRRINLTADIYPATAKNKKVIWSSDDSTIAQVSAGGQITGVSVGTTTIKVVSAENPNITAECVVKVCQAATQLEICNQCSINGGVAEVNDTIELNLYDNCVLNVRAYPENAAQIFTVGSSNVKSVAISINAEGKPQITALKSGVSRITITAADGSGVTANISVKVVTPVTDIEISTKNDVTGVGAGKTLAMIPIFNGGISVPENRNLTWSISLGEEYATVDQKGNLKANANITAPCHVTVRATATNGVYDEKDIVVCPLITGFSYPKGAYPSGNINECGNVYDFITPLNSGLVCNEFAFSSSNPSVVSVDKDGNYRALNSGTAKLSMKALDGSGKVGTVSITIRPLKRNISIKYNGTGPAVLYPGKKLTYSLVADPGYSNYKLTLAAEEYPTDNGYITPPISTDGYISTSGTTVTGGTELSNVIPGTVDTVKAILKSGETYRNFGVVSTIELYPAKTSSVQIITANGVDKVGKYYTLSLSKGDTLDLSPLVQSLPANACQSYYTYTSSNAKVVKVSPSGTLIAVEGGTANITVAAGDGSGVKTTIVVTVNKKIESLAINCTGLAYNNSRYYLASGKGVQFAATISNADATNKNLVWSLSGAGASYATIDQRGKITAKAGLTDYAEAVVVATAADGGGASAIAKVVLYPLATSLEIRDSDNNIVKNVTLNIDNGGVEYKIKRTPEKTANASIVAESSNTKLVTTSYDVVTGKLSIVPTGNGTGSVTVKVIMRDGSNKSTSIAVKLVKPITSISVDTKGSYSYGTVYRSADTYAGKTISLAANINADATTKKVIWVSSNTSVATVDAAGRVKALAPGVADIKAVSADGLSSVESIPLRVLVKETSVDSVKLTTLSNYSGTTVDSPDVAKTIKLANYSDIDNSKYSSSDYKNFAQYRVGIFGKEAGKAVASELQITSSKPDVAIATLTGTTLKVKAVKTGTTVISVIAADGSGKKATINVTVFTPVKKITVTTSTGYDYVAQGAKITLTANTNEDAANKKVKWEIIQNPEYATISATGVLTAKTDIGVGADKFVEVKATAIDGTNITNDLGRPIKIKIVPATAPTWTPKNESKDACAMSVGETKVITLENAYGIESYYQCTYVAGCGRVEYASRTLSTTKLNVKATKAGKLTITAAATDGSGKKYVYTITTTN
ncbi:MAG: Ig-like domain-containing protein [Lachnospiraceae bacterium]|nr:Ig-like domain-containing protein [Lachnospiraceae bacterium]